MAPGGVTSRVEPAFPRGLLVVHVVDNTPVVEDAEGEPRANTDCEFLPLGRGPQLTRPGRPPRRLHTARLNARPGRASGAKLGGGLTRS